MVWRQRSPNQFFTYGDYMTKVKAIDVETMHELEIVINDKKYRKILEWIAND